MNFFKPCDQCIIDKKITVINQIFDNLTNTQMFFHIKIDNLLMPKFVFFLNY